MARTVVRQKSRFQKSDNDGDETSTPPTKEKGNAGYISHKGRKMHPNSIKALNAINKAKKEHAQKPLTIPKDAIHGGKVNVNDLYSGRTYIVKT